MNKTQKNRCLWWIWILIFPIMLHAETIKLTAFQVATKNSMTRIALTFDKASVHRVFTLANPDRLVLDLQNTRLATSLKQLDVSDTAIKNIRIGHPVSSILRVVLDLNNHARVKIVSSLQDKLLVIDVYSSGEISKTKKTIMQASIKTNKFLAPENVLPRATPTHPLVIVLDPGHGGRDPGALGQLGSKEKNVTLSIARKLAEIINQQPNMRAVLTRKGDYFVPLRNRLQLARKGNADLFIAIHADSYFNDRAYGASVYALSAHGATSEAAHWLARRDNYSELGGVDLSELGDQSYLLRSVLIDLAQTATITDSLHLGMQVLSRMQKITILHYSHVEQAPFMVLKSPDIPSILVETGFLSNSDEELRLRDESYQNKLAESIFEGIRFYFKKYSTATV
ncbi:MAG: N-acetylmuramoyl-L-alanine amidase [Gammaproteobacteria bacterium]